MIVKARPKHAWDTSAYHRMVAAWRDADELVVDFEDGTRARVDAWKLLPDGVRNPDWPRMTLDRYELVVPTENGPVEIPWSRIRLLTDPAFDAHWRAMAAEEARIIGAWVARFRREGGMSRAELARRADVSAERLAEIEEGRARAGFATLERVLAPLGRTLDDLEGDPSEAAIGAATGAKTGAGPS